MRSHLYQLCGTFCAIFLLSFSFQTNLIAQYGGGGCTNDVTPPTAVCDYHTVVSLNYDGTAKVYAEVFDDGSTDDCAIAIYKVRRMTEGWCPYGVADDTQFRPYVEFCCADIGAPIWVVLRVMDGAGNYNECMSEVTVQDNSSPHIYCPPDITISCDYWFDYNDLYDKHSSTFGKVVHHYDDRDYIVINDPGNSWYPQPHNWGYDGYISGGGACGYGGGSGYGNLHLTVNDYTTCGLGYIYRTWTLGYGYNAPSCTQKIYIKDYSPFHGYSINWPWNYEADGCDYQNTDPDYLPHGYDKPYWHDDGCSLIGYSYDDKVFTFVDGACKKIVRTWTVIDWCRFDPHHPWYGGYWEHVQIIKLFNGDAPEFADCSDKVIDGFGPHCEGRVYLDPGITDDCTPPDKINYEYKVDKYMNGYIDIRRQGRTKVDEVLPVGWHKILWFVDDGCGNQSSCSFKVHVKDSKKPTPVCYNGLSSVVMPVGGMVTIWAKDFNASSFDNCTPEYHLKYSFSSDYNDRSHVFTCDDIGRNEVQIWVTDLAGNQQFCNTFIDVADNENICPSMNIISGTVQSFSGVAVADVEMSLYKIMPDASLDMDYGTTTDAQGKYQLGFGTTNFDRKVTATKESGLLEGVSALDLIQIQKHLLGYSGFTEPHQFYAADINQSKHVGISDLKMLRDLILGAWESTTLNFDLPWMIYPAACEVVDANGLFDFNCDMGAEIDHLNPGTDPVDFVAIKVGDVNGDAIEGITTRSANPYPIVAEKQETDDGVTITMKAGESMQSAGMQFSFSMPLDLVEAGVELYSGVVTVDKSNSYLNPATGTMNMVWAKPESAVIAEGDLLFTIAIGAQSTAVDAIDWSAGRFPNEIYTADDIKRDIQISWWNIQNTPAVPVEVAVMNRPNPFRVSTQIDFLSEVEGVAQLQVFDSAGKLVHARKLNLENGSMSIEIHRNQLTGSGLYVYKILTEADVYTGKMMQLD